MRLMLPNVSFSSLRVGTALRVICGAGALDHDGQRLAGAHAHDALHLGEAVDRTAVDAQDEIARLEAGRAAALSAWTTSTRADDVLGLP